jgi:nucleoside-diphosphate-sugar epimerase
MKVFVTGATGAIGRPLIAALLEGGHEVVAMTRSAEKGGALADAGVEPVVGDVLARSAVLEVVSAAEPDAIVHEATSLAGDVDLRHVDEMFAATNRLRTEGTDNLLAAARAAGVSRFIAQSFAGWPYARDGGPVKSEEDPLDPEPAEPFRRALDAIRRQESEVVGAEGLDGIALRYGGFYGPGTSLWAGGSLIEAIQGRKFPLVGGGTGVWSFVHVHDAAAATVAALERANPGIYNVVDDEPAPVAEWLPAVADLLGVKPPRRVPAWAARLLAGEAAVVLMTEIRGASNAKAKRELGWRLRYPSWRDGFKALADAAGRLAA